MINLNGISVVIRVDNRQVAIPAEHVREMVSMPRCTTLPNAPKHIRGVVNLRGRVLPAVDTRMLLGMVSARAEAEQLVNMLKQREEEHRRWIAELEASIRECREFRLATDPTKCAFGKWYYSFKAENSETRMLLAKFEDPHREIHRLGVDTRALYDKGQGEEAIRQINSSRHTLQLLLDLFASLYKALLDGSREIGMILDDGSRAGIFAVDSVLAVEPVLDSSGESNHGIMSWVQTKRFMRGVGIRRADKSLVLLADSNRFLECTGIPAG